ncbi:hypothetical protein EJ06DRAFT_525826 [Trichodelitschia bisporula]|uniref:Uncharacterized protein n=1 Tax=Trichodelitschia bisporula TaxID=703511 RepID=A0A6G1IAI9_9PEZI|nr:hypothetical protein EJ06DRAFT_525826 [Trichodelitschia bisporula]
MGNEVSIIARQRRRQRTAVSYRAQAREVLVLGRNGVGAVMREELEDLAMAVEEEEDGFVQDLEIMNIPPSAGASFNQYSPLPYSAPAGGSGRYGSGRNQQQQSGPPRGSGVLPDGRTWSYAQPPPTPQTRWNNTLRRWEMIGPDGIGVPMPSAGSSTALHDGEQRNRQQQQRQGPRHDSGQHRQSSGSHPASRSYGNNQQPNPGASVQTSTETYQGRAARSGANTSSARKGKSGGSGGGEKSSGSGSKGQAASGGGSKWNKQMDNQLLRMKRRPGATWDNIAQNLNISPQEAERRFLQLTGSDSAEHENATSTDTNDGAHNDAGSVEAEPETPEKGGKASTPSKAKSPEGPEDGKAPTSKTPEQAPAAAPPPPPDPEIERDVRATARLRARAERESAQAILRDLQVERQRVRRQLREEFPETCSDPDTETDEEVSKRRDERQEKKRRAAAEEKAKRDEEKKRRAEENKQRQEELKKKLEEEEKALKEKEEKLKQEEKELRDKKKQLAQEKKKAKKAKQSPFDDELDEDDEGERKPKRKTAKKRRYVPDNQVYDPCVQNSTDSEEEAAPLKNKRKAKQSNKSCKDSSSDDVDEASPNSDSDEEYQKFSTGTCKHSRKFCSKCRNYRTTAEEAKAVADARKNAKASKKYVEKHDGKSKSKHHRHHAVEKEEYEESEDYEDEPVESDDSTSVAVMNSRVRHHHTLSGPGRNRASLLKSSFTQDWVQANRRAASGKTEPKPLRQKKPFEERPPRHSSAEHQRKRKNSVIDVNLSDLDDAEIVTLKDIIRSKPGSLTRIAFDFARVAKKAVTIDDIAELTRAMELEESS